MNTKKNNAPKKIRHENAHKAKAKAKKITRRRWFKIVNKFRREESTRQLKKLKY